MGRYELIEMLKNYNPLTSQEHWFRSEMIAFIKEHENCFERTLEIGHITSSAWLLNRQKDKALLLHHSKLDNWFQLGGHCDGNQDVLNVAIKEAKEESGIENIEPVREGIFDIDIHVIPATNNDKEHYHYDIRFLLQVTSDELVVQNNESKALRWISKNPKDLPTDNVSVVRMFNKWITMLDL